MLRRRGPWLPRAAEEQEHVWLNSGLGYEWDFDLRRLSKKEPYVQVFGAARAPLDFAFPCTQVNFSGDVAVGKLQPACQSHGCKLVMQQMWGRLINRVSTPAMRLNNPPLCEFSFVGGDSPHSMTWSIVWTTGARPIARIGFTHSAVDLAKAPAFQETALKPKPVGMANRMQTALASAGPWGAETADVLKQHPWLAEAVKYRTNFYSKGLHLEAANPRKLQRVYVFGGQVSGKDRVFFCTRLRFYETFAVGDLVPVCKGAGCLVESQMWMDLIARADRRTAENPSLKCNFSFGSELPPRLISWDVISPDACARTTEPCAPLVRIPLRRGVIPSIPLKASSVADSQPTAMPPEEAANLKRFRALGPWIPSHGVAARETSWLSHAVRYRFNFEYRSLVRDTFIFGGAASDADFAYPCVRMELFEDFAVGDFSPVCVAAGCEQVVGPLQQEIQAGMGANASRLHELKCHFSWASAANPHDLTWDIVRAEVSGAHARESAAERGAPILRVSLIGGSRSLRQLSPRAALDRQRRLRECGPWVPTGMDHKHEHPWLASATATYMLNWDRRKEQGRGARDDFGDAHDLLLQFGWSRVETDFVPACTWLEFYETFAVGELAPACGSQGCSAVVEQMWSAIGAPSESRTLPIPPLACVFTFAPGDCPRELRWEIVPARGPGDAARGAAIAPIRLEPDLTWLAKQEIAQIIAQGGTAAANL